MMYVSERSADSIWETWLAFLVTKSSYMASHFGGRESALRRWIDRGPGDGLALLCVSAGDDIVLERMCSRHWLVGGWVSSAVDCTARCSIEKGSVGKDLLEGPDDDVVGRSARDTCMRRQFLGGIAMSLGIFLRQPQLSAPGQDSMRIC